MKFTVYHRTNPDFRSPTLIRPDEPVAVELHQYAQVATVEAGSLEEVFQKTQNLERDWVTNPGVTTDLGHCIRSTSVGDLVHGEAALSGYAGWWLVADIGFARATVIDKKHRTINFSPYATNVLDCVGRKDLVTPDGTPIEIRLDPCGFSILGRGAQLAGDLSNLGASYWLNSHEVGFSE